MGEISGFYITASANMDVSVFGQKELHYENTRTKSRSFNGELFSSLILIAFK